MWSVKVDNRKVRAKYSFRGDGYVAGGGAGNDWNKMNKINESVLDEVNERRTTMNIMTKRKIMSNGHRLRQNQLVTINMERTINSKRTRGRPRKSIFE